MPAFFGMRGTGDWVAEERPKSWREAILMLYPNGSVPLTALMSKMGEEQVSDPEFNWWTKKLPEQRGVVTGIYTDVIMATAYAAGAGTAVAGDILYLKMAEATCKEFRIGHQVLMRDASDFTMDVNGKVISRVLNGASSNIGVKLLEADDNSTQTHGVGDCDVVLIIGSINPEGAIMPQGVSYDPTKYFNYTQIFRTPLSITRTARLTKYRTGDKYKEMKREALELHGIEMERGAMFGIKTENTGDNSKPERTTQGLIPFIRENVAANVNDFRLNATYTGKAWLDVGGGDSWLEAYLETVFRYGSGEKLALCGSGTILGLIGLVKSGSHYNIDTNVTVYGLKLTEWKTPFGSIYLKTHPLMSIEATLRNSMLILEPRNMKYRYITDTTFYGEGQSRDASQGNNANRKDATDEEFLTECGYEFWHPDTFMYLDGFGQANIV
jgi:hypothetical protein